MNNTWLLAVIAFVVAIIFFVVALVVVSATTNPTSVQHYEDIGFIAVAAGLALLSFDRRNNGNPVA